MQHIVVSAIALGYMMGNEGNHSHGILNYAQVCLVPEERDSVATCT